MPSKPTSFETVSVTTSSVTLQWKPPRDTNGVIKSYSIQYGENDVIHDFGDIMSDPITGKIERLLPDTKYTLKLTARTRVGEGLPANVTIKTSKLIKKPILLC